MKKILQVFFFLSCFIGSYAQQQQGAGLILDDPEYDEIEQLSPFTGSKFNNTPLFYSLKPYCPKIQNQQDISSCVGWATGYGAMTIMAAIKNNWTDKDSITENAFSALYLYNKIKIKDCSSGSKLSKAVVTLKEGGNCSHKDFDYPVVDCEKTPDDNLVEQAQNFKIKDFFRLYNYSDRPQDILFKTKKSIAEDKPVIIGMVLRQNFYELGSNDEYWEPYEGDTMKNGGHAMVIIGYNEGKRAFEVMNSWGEYWGNDGFMWIKYDDFLDHIIYGYQIVLPDNFSVSAFTEKTEVEVEEIDSLHLQDSADTNTTETKVVSVEPIPKIGGSFAFQYPTWNKNDELQFIEPAYSFDGKYYELEKKDWEIGSQFQLVTKNVTKDKYVYVFSIDAENNTTIHFPKKEIYNADEFKGFNESALIPYDNVEILIPGENLVLQKEHKGIDFLCVFYSDIKLEHFDQIVKEILASPKEEISDKVMDVLGEDIIPYDNIAFTKNKMECYSTSKTGQIIPLILKVEGN